MTEEWVEFEYLQPLDDAMSLGRFLSAIKDELQLMTFGGLRAHTFLFGISRKGCTTDFQRLGSRNFDSCSLEALRFHQVKSD